MVHCAEIQTTHTPESLAVALQGCPGLVVLRSGRFELPEARYSLVAARPFLTFRAFGSRCEIHSVRQGEVVVGDPWFVLDELLARYEQAGGADLPFPAGGCFGFWGYDLRYFTEPKLSRNPQAGRALRCAPLSPGSESSVLPPTQPAPECQPYLFSQLPEALPDCHLGFCGSLVVFDHRLDKCWVISTGLIADGSRCPERARRETAWWRQLLEAPPPGARTFSSAAAQDGPQTSMSAAMPPLAPPSLRLISNLTREEFITRVERAQEYIRQGHIYQVNLSHRISTTAPCSSWEFFERLSSVSPAPFSAFLDAGDFQLVSSSPELFLRLSGGSIRTRPIKGTRPRSPDPAADLRLACELQTSAKEMAELVMITDLLRNDLGRVCEFGSVQVPDHARLERFSHVQHLVSTVEGRLRPGQSHLRALAACFPGGSITGAPKFRAMEIIDELETVPRGPYTGALGYLGFNRESQLSIIIRTALCAGGQAHFHVGAGVVADPDPAAEYDETIAKARGFLQVIETIPLQPGRPVFCAPPPTPNP